MKLYLANMQSVADFNCYQDDGGDCVNVYEYAEPRGQCFTSVVDALNHYLAELEEQAVESGDKIELQAVKNLSRSGLTGYWDLIVCRSECDVEVGKLYGVVSMREFPLAIKVTKEFTI